MSPIKQKILLLLLSGVAIGFSYSPNRQFKILKNLSREWKKINRGHLRDNIRNLYRSHLVMTQENPDGTFTYTLTEKGKLKALTYNFQSIKIKKTAWDGKWRVVIFDIPEELKRARDALRQKLKEIGFHEFQKSVFIFPYPCKDEIDFIIEFFNIRKFTRFGTIDFIDNDLHLREIFGLI